MTCESYKWRKYHPFWLYREKKVHLLRLYQKKSSKWIFWTIWMPDLLLTLICKQFGLRSDLTKCWSSCKFQTFYIPMVFWMCLKHLCTRINILAHWIKISEILFWDRKSYLSHAILPRLSREGYMHWLYWNSSTLSSSDVIVVLKWRHHVQLHLSAFTDFQKLIIK